MSLGTDGGKASTLLSCTKTSSLCFCFFLFLQKHLFLLLACQRLIGDQEKEEEEGEEELFYKSPFIHGSQWIPSDKPRLLIVIESLCAFVVCEP